jgi:uncharacterized membrane protein
MHWSLWWCDNSHFGGDYDGGFFGIVAYLVGVVVPNLMVIMLLVLIVVILPDLMGLTEDTV